MTFFQSAIGLIALLGTFAVVFGSYITFRMWSDVLGTWERVLWFVAMATLVASGLGLLYKSIENIGLVTVLELSLLPCIGILLWVFLQNRSSHRTQSIKRHLT